MPKLWTDTLEAHRREVRDAIVDTTAALISEHGLRSVTMSQIAEETGIGRATLYRYFPAVDEILQTWHERHVTAHLEHLGEVRDRAGSPGERLEAVVRAYATITQHRPQGDHDPELAAFLQRVHRGEHATGAQQQLRDLFRDLLVDAAAAGDVRSDVSADELTTYCLHALGAARHLPSDDAVNRLVDVVLDGIHAT